MPAPIGSSLTGRTRYREQAFTGALVLQVEEEVRRPRIHGDGYQGGDGILVTRWRDARPRDLPQIDYHRGHAS